MALARPRPSRPSAPRPSHRTAPVHADAFEPADEASLADIVAEAAEAADRSMRDVADAMGLDRAELDVMLLRPASLARDAVDRLARALGVDRTLFRRAVAAAAAAATARDGSPEEEDDIEPPAAPTAADASATAAAAAPAGDETAAVTRQASAPPARPPAPPAEPPPLEAIDVVARALAAIAEADDHATAEPRLRRAVLEGVRQAARDAGRAVPPAWRDVGAALRAASPATGQHADDEPIDAGEAPSAAARDEAVLDAAARAVRALQRLSPGYDDVFSPAPDEAVADLLRRLTIRVHRAPLGRGGAAALVAPVFGRYLLVHAAEATPDQQRLVERRAAAHVVAGHVRADAPLPVPAPVDGPFDRVADVAALADLVPFWLVHDLRRARGGRKAAVAHVAELVRRIAGDWEERRVHDRAALRVELHRKHGL